MNNDQEFVAHCLELMKGMGESVISKRMFGGYGIFREGLMFALIADGELYLKVDAENDEKFADLELPKFTYMRGAKGMHLGYRLAPETAFQNREKMKEWAQLGWEAAIRADEAKPPGKRKRQGSS